MKKAILIENAKCNGSGSNRWKTVSGITKNVIKQIEQIAGKQNYKTSVVAGDAYKIFEDTFGNDNVCLLAYSNTNYQNQKYKLIINIRNGYNKTHRQINDSDYEIIATI